MADNLNVNLAKTKVLAEIAKYGGTFSDLQQHYAFTLISMYCNNNAELLQDLFKEYLKSDEQINLAETCEIISQLPVSERVEFLRDCWYVAQNGEEFSQKTSEIGQKIAKILGISEQDSLLALKSVG